MKLVNTHEAKTHLSQLLSQVEKEGEVVRICRSGKPIAEMRQVREPIRRLGEPHPKYGRIKVKGDLFKPLEEGDLPEDLKNWKPSDAA
jgi:antitoxin (DNA-binding transcriptional repressor) of toxin-antitoxin stability system